MNRPKELKDTEAEEKEQIIHIHFDAKYKVKNKQENSKFKDEDVFKMHAYKDAIRRTGGGLTFYTQGPMINQQNLKVFMK